MTTPETYRYVVLMAVVVEAEDSSHACHVAMNFLPKGTTFTIEDSYEVDDDEELLRIFGEQQEEVS